MDATTLTLDALKTAPGQIAAVLLVVQMLKQMIPTGFNKSTVDLIVQGLTIVAGVGLQFIFVGATGTQGYVLVTLNGLIVAAAAMKAFEATKAAVPTVVAARL